MMVTMPHQTEGLIVQKSFTTTSFITVFQKFAFDVNGTLHFEKTAFHPPQDKNRAFFYLCDSRQWPSFVGVATDAPEKLCQFKKAHTNSTRQPIYGGCTISQLYFDDPVLTDYAIPSADMYRFVLINCPPELIPSDTTDKPHQNGMAKDRSIDQDEFVENG